jgi:hypothetical protein
MLERRNKIQKWEPFGSFCSENLYAAPEKSIWCGAAAALQKLEHLRVPPHLPIQGSAKTMPLILKLIDSLNRALM